MNSVIQIIEKVNISYPNEFYLEVAEYLKKKKKKFIVTANPEIIMNGRKMDLMNDILCNKATIIPDGIGVAKAAQLIVGKEVKRNTGIQLVEFLLEEANRKHYTVFIYGSKQSTINDFLEVSKLRWPNVVYSSTLNGYDYKKETVLPLIKEQQADIYLVALGTPNQELFINQFYDVINKGVCIGVGGSLDVLSGHIKRAPKIFIKLNLEWLYRITTQPQRLGRFVKGNIGFVFVLLKELIQLRFTGRNRINAKKS